MSYQTRECHDVDSEGTPRCTGGDKKYFSCNTQVFICLTLFFFAQISLNKR